MQSKKIIRIVAVAAVVLLLSMAMAGAASADGTTYSITYKDQGDKDFSGTHEDGYPTTHTYGTATTLDSPTKNRFTFGGWFKESDCSGTVVTVLGAEEVTSNITLYAKWMCSLTYDGNGATSGEVPTDSSSPYNYDTNAGVLGNTGSLEKTGYDFGGWNSWANGRHFSYDEGDQIKMVTNETLYAKWVGSVTYNANGGSGSVPTDDSSYIEGNEVTVKGNTGSLEKSNCYFAGWNTQADGNGTAYYPGQIFKFTGNITLYAKWVSESTTYTVTLPSTSNMTYSGTWKRSTDSGTSSGTTMTGVPEGATVTITAALSGSGKKVVRAYGWSATDTSGSVYVSGDNNIVEFTMPGSDVTVTAVEEDALPDGYTEVEYIESTDGQFQYIDTECAINKLSDIKMDFAVDYFTKVTSGGVAIGSNSMSGTEMMLMYQLPYSHYINGEHFYYDMAYGKRYKIDLNITVGSSSLRSNGALVFTGSRSNTPNGTPFYLFGGIDTSGHETIESYVKMKIYSVKLYDTSGKLVRNYVPCKNLSGAAGLYDTVNGKFYGNQGTGDDFNAGNFMVTYYKNDGSVEEYATHLVTDANNLVTLSDGTGLTAPSGKIFAGWNTVQNPTEENPGVTYGPEQSLYVANNLTLYAKWIDSGSSTFSVGYNANGADSGSAPVNQVAGSDGTIIIAGNTGYLMKNGDTFGGWNTEADGSGTDYTVNAEETLTDNLTLYAKWNAITYVIVIPPALTLDSSGGATTAVYSVSMTSSAVSGDERKIYLSLKDSANYSVSPEGFKVKNIYADNYQGYTVKKSDSTSVGLGDDIVTVRVDGDDGTSDTETLKYQLSGTAAYAGTYQDTLTFEAGVSKSVSLALEGGTWQKGGTTVTGVVVPIGSTINVSGNTVTFTLDGCADVVLTHEGSEVMKQIGNTGSMRDVVSDSTTVQSTDTTLHWGLPSGYTEVEYIESTGTQ